MNPNLIERVRSYLARVPGAVSGAEGHKATFHAACLLVQGFNLTPAEALPILLEWNTTCQPPWGEADLRHKLADAEKAPPRRPRGHLLGISRAGMSPRPVRPFTPATEHGKDVRPLPNRTGFGHGTREQVQRLSTLRPYHREGLEWAQERGLLVFGSWRGFECHGLTDASGRVLELRRMDGKTFPAVPRWNLRERKSHAVGGTQKRWPLGILEVRDFPAIALVEGLPDFLTAHYLVRLEQSNHPTRCAPVGMLSGSPDIHADALPMFKGKTVRIYPHSDALGLKGAAKWQGQLYAAGAVRVDVFDFSPYRKTDGSRLNDLWEFVHQLHPDDAKNPVTGRIMP